MSEEVERRVASSMYEENFLPKETSFEKLKEPSLNIVKLSNNLYRSTNENFKSVDEWIELFEKAAFFKGYEIIIGEIVIMVYDDPDSHMMSSVLFSCLGEFHFNSFTLDNKSRFFDACKNLDKNSRKSNVRRALAITLLKCYGLMDPNKVKCALNITTPFEWDETVAGELASSMKLISSKSPSKIGQALLDLGFLQPHYVQSTLLDVIYEDKPEVIDSNNKLVYLLGQQLEQLFDPLTEYSPESTDILYRPPENASTYYDSELVQDICKELLQLQENTTTQLVKFLREAVIPIRMKTLNGEIKGLTTTKVNQVFPPTIDEVTRVNCIFLEALKNSSQYGSFEIVKACGSTIPYFYKATMRHESALKNFNANLKDFLTIYGHYIPSEYSEAHIDVILKSQLNLTKIKMILNRLVKTKSWLPSEKFIVDQNLKNAIDTIDSFGKEELRPYNKRVFTPSGKILTEICQNWPPALSYGWVNRKVVSVIDTVNQNNREKGVIVLFSDYAIFLNIVEDDEEDLYSAKPQVSDILMNSLINENPIHNIPTLTVSAWCPLSNLDITTFGENSVSFFFKDGKSSASVFEMENTSKFIRVFNKALILSKTTPFHLFQIDRFGFNIFVTAHESSTYIREDSHTPIALFLNIAKDKQLLTENNIEFGLFAKFVEDDLIKVDTVTLSGNSYSNTINSSDFSSFLSEEISNLETKRHSIESSKGFAVCSSGNLSLLVSSVSKPLHQRNSINVSGNSFNAGERISSYSSVRSNKPLPKIVNKDLKYDDPSPKLTKKSKLKNRLSKIFNIKEKSEKPNVNQPAKQQIIAKSSKTPSQEQFEEDIFDLDIPELSSFDDVKTFESTMSPIFDEDLKDNKNFEIFNDDSANWILERENSSFRMGSNAMKTEIISLTYKDSYTAVTSHDRQLLIEPEATLTTNETRPRAQVRTIFQNQDDSSSFQRSGSTRKSSANGESVLSRLHSIDDDFPSPLLKVGIESQEDINRDYDTYYTPKSSNIGFQDYEAGKKSDSILDFEFESFDSNQVNVTEQPNTRILHSQESFSEAASFKSCLDDEEFIDHLPLTLRNEDDLGRDDSFRYLAKIVEGSFKVNDLKRSDTFQTLPRSYSSLKYLASYIDSNFTIDP